MSRLRHRPAPATGSGEEFRFSADWFVPYPPEQVAEVLTDLEHYPRWWPDVVAVASLGPDQARVLCRSRLPYRLDLVLTARSRTPPVLHVDLDGDLVGEARYELTEQPGGTDLRYRQQVRVTGRLLRYASRLARPLLIWNHDLMMERCREGLTRELGSVHRRRDGGGPDRAAGQDTGHDAGRSDAD